MGRIILGNQFCVTGKHYIGLVPSGTQRDDIVRVSLGIKMPLVIRPIGGGHYQLVGECYLHGIKYGEVLQRGFPLREYNIR